MKLSEEAMSIIEAAMDYAKLNAQEYVTPELILLSMLDNTSFRFALEECGGDCQLLEKNLQEYLADHVGMLTTKEPEFSLGSTQLLNFAGQSAFNSSSKEIALKHLVHGLWNLDNSYAVYYMEQQNLNERELLQEMANLEDIFNDEEFSIKEDEQDEAEYQLALYAPCLNDTLKANNPLIGREAELERTIQILCRKDKNNPLHIGEPGVGKTAITYGLVQLIKNNKVPVPLQGAKIYSLDLGSMLAGAQYRGDFEKRLKKVLATISKEDKPIIYIDEIHNLAGAGAVGTGSLDASNMLKPYLADGKIRFIGATTYEEYKKHFEKNKSLVRRFQPVEIKEPTEAEAVKILEGIRKTYESFHGVKYARGVLEYAVNMSAKYIHECFLPDKAIDLIDEAGAYRKLHPLEQKTQTVNKDLINEVLSKICRVPLESVKTEDISGLATLETRLQHKVFGQKEAITQVVNAVKFSKAGLLEPNKPLASLLFVGPTGVGKTEIARSLAQELGIPLLRFDMSEYGEKHAVAKLIGSPAGYVGYEEGGLLTEAIRKTPSAVLLLDEIEKAHADIYNILLQVMDYATLTDNQGRKADFRNIIIIMTSNAGANKLGKSGIGFQSEILNQGVITEELTRLFQPEFRNRLNKIVLFNSMDEQMATRIVDKKLNELALLLATRKIIFSAAATAKELLIVKGISEQFGAREVDRVIRNEIKPLFVDEMLFGTLKKGGHLELIAEDNNFKTLILKE